MSPISIFFIGLAMSADAFAAAIGRGAAMGRPRLGDALRAGLIFGIEKGYDWLTVGRMGNLMGALKVEHPGTQNQRFTFDELTSSSSSSSAIRCKSRPTATRRRRPGAPLLFPQPQLRRSAVQALP